MSGRFGHAALRWFRSARPRRRAAGFAAGKAGVERLEGRVLLTAGDVMWSPPADFYASADDEFYDVAVQPDGKIVAVGTAMIGNDRDFLVARYTADGRLDRSFGFASSGYRTHHFGPTRGDVARGVVVQADGKIVVVGTSYLSGGAWLALLRLNRDGSVDATYGSSGQVIERQGGNFLDVVGDGVALTADGGVVIAVGSSSTDFVYKYTAGGVKDVSFNGTGFRDLNSGSAGYPVDLAIDAAGRIVTLSNDGSVRRLTSAGAFDNTFSGDGVRLVSLETGTSPEFTSVSLLADGRIVAGGQSFDGTHYLPGVVRLEADGDYDGTFDGNGRYSFDPVANVSDYLEDLAVLANGTVVAAGYDGASFGDGWVVVLAPGGVRDSGFSGDGMATWVGGGDDRLRGVAVTAAGQYVVAGTVGSDETDDAGGIVQFEGRYPRRADLLGWAGSGDWYAAGSTGSAFGTSYFGRWNRNAGWKVVETADLDGDGDADVLGRDSTGQWWIGRNTGTAFATVAGAKWNEAAGWRDLRIADFDGDGRADIAARTSTGQWWVSLSTGTGLANGALWARWNKDAGWQDVLAADFDGDGRSDLAGRTSGGQWYVGRSTGTGFTLALWDTWSATGGWRDVTAGDFDGDGRQDLAGRAGNGQWWVSRSTGSAFVKSPWGTWNANAGWVDVGVGDFDRDGRADLLGRASNGQWFLAVSTGAGFATQFWAGWSNAAGWRDVRIGDFDGDGRSDIAGRTGGGEWHATIWRDGAVTTTRWGKWSEAAGWTTFGGELVRTA